MKKTYFLKSLSRMIDRNETKRNMANEGPPPFLIQRRVWEIKSLLRHTGANWSGNK